MKPTINISIFLTLALLAIPAAGRHMNEKHSPCANVVMTSELTKCLSVARDTADANLNTVYKEIRGRLQGANAENLTKTQRLWIQYRDANCSAERDLYEGGTAKYPVYFACLESMTRGRTRDWSLHTSCD
ncbi:MAG: lysozyme inhibitor LprI family protein [Candidatus Sulfotelmatobacter sp.]